MAIIKRILTAVALIGAAGAAFADDFPLSGNYTQNVLCKGDGTDPVAVRVKISPQEIVSNVGTCTILDTTRDGETYAVRVECKFPSGPLMGNLSFTPKPDRTIVTSDTIPITITDMRPPGIPIPGCAPTIRASTSPTARKSRSR